MVLTAKDETSKPLSLWVTPVSDIGGVGRHFLDVASTGLPGFRLAFLVPEGPLAEELRGRGAAVQTAKFGESASLLESIASLRGAVKALGPSLVHTHLAFADIVSALTPLPRGVVRVSTEHGIAAPDIYQSGLKAKLMKQVHHFRTSRFASIIAVSRSTQDVMARNWKPLAPVKLIYNGVARTDSGFKPQPHLTVLSLARLSHEKQIHKLIDGFSALLKLRPDARLVIGGIGPDEVSLKQQVESLGISQSVSFPGFVDAQNAMNNADVLVQLSKWENCSYSLLDAKVRGLGIVATRVGGNPEIVNEDSLIDSLEAYDIAQAIVRQARGNTDTKWATVEEMCIQTAQHYMEVLAR